MFQVRNSTLIEFLENFVIFLAYSLLKIFVINFLFNTTNKDRAFGQCTKIDFNITHTDLVYFNALNVCDKMSYRSDLLSI